MNLIYSLLMLAVFLFMGLGFEVGINDNMVAVNSMPVLDEILLIVFVSMMILGALKSMNGIT